MDLATLRSGIVGFSVVLGSLRSFSPPGNRFVPKSSEREIIIIKSIII